MTDLHLENFEGWVIPMKLSARAVANLAANPRMVIFIGSEPEDGAQPDVTFATFDKPEGTFHNSLNIENALPEQAVAWRRAMERAEKSLPERK